MNPDRARNLAVSKSELRANTRFNPDVNSSNYARIRAFWARFGIILPELETTPPEPNSTENTTRKTT